MISVLSFQELQFILNYNNNIYFWNKAQQMYTIIVNKYSCFLNVHVVLAGIVVQCVLCVHVICGMDTINYGKVALSACLNAHHCIFAQQSDTFR